MNRAKYILFFVLIAMLYFSSCKSRKIKSIEPKTELSSVDSLFMKINSHKVDFENIKIYFSAKVDIDGKENRFKGQIRMKKDSIIWVSISPGLGIELFRMVITKDSALMVNKFNNTFFKTTVSNIDSILNVDVDFGMIQALILGNDIPYYETKNFTLNSDNDFYYLNTVSRKKLKEYIENSDDKERIIIQRIKVDKRTNKIIGQFLKQIKSADKSLIISYYDFKMVENHLIPHQTVFSLKDKNNRIELKLNYNRLSLENDLSFPFKIPDSYSEMK